MILRRAFSAAAAILSLSTAAMGGSNVLCSDESFFKCIIEQNFYAEDFASIPTGSQPEGLAFSENGFSYEVTTVPGVDGGANTGLFNDPGLLSTSSSARALRITFTSGNVTAVGGEFFAGNAIFFPLALDVIFTLNDGSTVTYEGTPSEFRGFISPLPISHITIDAPNKAILSYPTVNSLCVGQLNLTESHLVTSESGFVSHLAPDFYFDNFNTIPTGSQPEGLPFSMNGYSWEARTVPGVDGGSGGNGLSNVTGILSTNFSNDALQLRFTSGNITAVGGDFFATDNGFIPVSSSVILTLNDGSTTTFNAIPGSTFRGYVSPVPITSLTIDTEDIGQPLWPSAGSVYVGSRPHRSCLITDMSEFMAKLDPLYYAENFDTIPTGVQPSGLTFFANGFSYEASSAEGVDGGSGTGGLFNEPGLLSLNFATDALRITFTSGNVTAVGGDFFSTDFNLNPESTEIILTLSDGTTETYSPTKGDFRGFISTHPIQSITIDAPDDADFHYPTASSLIVGQFAPIAVPVCPGDLNDDLVVDILDLNSVLGNFQRQVPPGTQGDQNCDGAVNILDLNITLGNFQQNCNLVCMTSGLCSTEGPHNHDEIEQAYRKQVTDHNPHSSSSAAGASRSQRAAAPSP